MDFSGREVMEKRKEGWDSCRRNIWMLSSEREMADRAGWEVELY